MEPAALLAAWSRAFAWTQVVELPIWALAARASGVPIPRGLLAGLLGTAVSHPLLWFAWPHVVGSYTAYLVSGEIGVVLVETVLFAVLARVSWRRALLASILANGASLAVGWVLAPV